MAAAVGAVWVLGPLAAKLKDATEGCLVVGMALEESGAFVLLDVLHVQQPLAGDGHEALADAADTLPFPLSVVATFAATADAARQLALAVAAAPQPACSPTVALHRHGSASGLAAATVSGGHCVPLEVLDAGFAEWLRTECILCRCHVKLSISVMLTAPPAGASAAPATAAATAGAAELRRDLTAAVQRAAAQLASPHAVLHATTSTARGGPGVLLTSGSGGTSLATLVAPDVLGSSSRQQPVVQVVPLLDSSAAAAAVGSTAPALHVQPLASSSGGGGSSGRGTCTACPPVPVSLDVLAYVPLGSASDGRQLHSLMVGALQRQLVAVPRAMAKAGKPVPVRAYHFLPPGRTHHVTALYPSLASDPELNESKLLPTRQRLHAALGLPPDRPMLRLANALDMAQAHAGGGGADEDAEGRPSRLKDVHATLTPPAIGGGVWLVQGGYEYCHYMQDRFNDSGWGCAYRSLQTICSWFREQKYSAKPIPTHREVQEALVAIGDKPRSFVGSSSWIGAIELGYVLDARLGVTCKVMTVARGSDIPGHARQLAAHFADVGTPVMIGGGVLAYTLLGVAFNEDSGDAAFLILDPHYTGGEDLRKIQQGGWVGWKRLGDSAAAGGPLFVADAFYNFLCPQRPDTV